MSIYTFAPMASMPQNYPFVTWENAFTDEEMDQIVKYCDENLKIDKAIISDVDKEEEYSQIRSSKTGWLGHNHETSWIYDRLAHIGSQLNAKFYNFDLFGFVEDIQYTIYDSEEQGHYTWHLDMTGIAVPPRKFTLVLQLTDPEEYEGGHIQTLAAAEESTVVRQRGLVTAFPSWVLHRVTPVTKGVRKTLVVWIAGPQFK